MAAMSDTTTAGCCVLHHRKPVTADHGLLCGHHLAGMREGLQDVLELFAMARLYLLPGSVDSEGIKHTKAAEAPAPLRLEVVALSDRRNPAPIRSGDIPDVPGTLEDWAGWVVAERDLPAMKRGWSISDSVRLLQAHLSWIAAQDMVDDFDQTIRDLRRAVAGAAGEQAPKPVGRCPSPEPDGTCCDGPLWPAGDGVMAVDCGRCERHYDERFLRHLGGMMEASA